MYAYDLNLLMNRDNERLLQFILSDVCLFILNQGLRPLTYMYDK